MNILDGVPEGQAPECVHERAAVADAVEEVHELMEDMEPDSAREGAPLSR